MGGTGWRVDLSSPRSAPMSVLFSAHLRAHGFRGAFFSPSTLLAHPCAHAFAGLSCCFLLPPPPRLLLRLQRRCDLSAAETPPVVSRILRTRASRWSSVR